MTATSAIARFIAYALAACAVSATAAPGAPAGRGSRRAGPDRAAVSVFDCRRPAETGHRVPHERLLWMPSGDRFDGERFPRYRPHAERPGVVELVFDGKLDATVVLNCGEAASELIRGVEIRGKIATVALVGSDVRWRVDRPANALLVWSPRHIARAISRAWPGDDAAEILAQARQLGMAPENADQLERRLVASHRRVEGLDAFAGGRYEDAARDLQTAFEAVPNDVEAGLALARARYRLRLYDGAEELLESLASVAPRSAEIRHEQGLLALSRERRAEARRHFSAAADGGWPNASFYLGFLAFEEKDDPSAATALDRFLAEGGEGPLAARARTMLEVIRARQAARSSAVIASRAPRPAPPPRPRPRPAPVPAPPPAPPPATREPPAGEGAPSIDAGGLVLRGLILRGFDRRDLPLASLAGRPVVLHLWATWCPPCRQEIPSLMRFTERVLPALAESGLALVTVSMDYTEDELAGATETWATGNEGMLPPIFWDPNWIVAERLGLGSALPQTVLVQPDGTVEAVLIGAQDWQDPRLVERFAQLVAAGEDRQDD